MYENYTVESIKKNIVEQLKTKLDVREGSFTNDMISAVSYELWKVYQSLNAVIPIAFVDETSGAYIDKRCAEYGIRRKDGTKSTAVMTYTGINGTVIPAGKVFQTHDGLQFVNDTAVTISNGTAQSTVTASEIGETYNVEAGAITFQITSLTGLNSAMNAAATGGTDQETDAALVARLYDYLKNTSTSGNIAHYRQWALSVNGVGKVKVTPLWNGAGTVKVLIVGPDNEPVDSTVVGNCADYIEENRPLGATVTVQSATGLSIDVAATITVDTTTTIAAVQTAFAAALDTYLKSIAFSKYTLIYNRVANMLMDIKGVTDYSALTINGGKVNVTIAEDQVPVLGTVVIN